MEVGYEPAPFEFPDASPSSFCWNFEFLPHFLCSSIFEYALIMSTKTLSGRFCKSNSCQYACLMSVLVSSWRSHKTSLVSLYHLEEDQQLVKMGFWIKNMFELTFSLCLDMFQICYVQYQTILCHSIQAFKHWGHLWIHRFQIVGEFVKRGFGNFHNA